MALGIYMLLTFGASTTLCQLLTETSEFRLRSHEPRSYVTHGEKLIYRYSLDLDDIPLVNEMRLHINGTYIERAENGSDIIVSVLKDLSASRFSGFVAFYVSDTTPLGTLLRPIMYITILSNDVVKYKTRLLGEYLFMVIPDIHVSGGIPTRVDMKEMSKINSKVVLPTGPMGSSLLKVFMPNNVTTSKDAVDLYIEEPFLSITKLDVVGNTGLLKESVELVGKISPYYMSNSRSSENDQVSVAIPAIDVQYGATGEVDFVAEVEALDFAGADDDIEMMIGYVLEVGDGIFVIRNSSLYTDMKSSVQRIPLLSTFAELREVIKGPSEYNILLEVGLEHADESWGSAYNTSWNVFLPAYLDDIQVQRTTDMLRSSRRVYNDRTVSQSSVFEFELKRLSFVHKARVTLNMTLDLDHEEFDQQQMTVYIEAVYNNWRQDDDFVTSMGFSFKIDVPVDTALERTCRCTDDVLFKCACGKPEHNGCDVTDNQTRCVDCGTPWHCVKTLPGYGKKSKLNDRLGNKYRCGKAERNKRLGDITPCIHIDNNGYVTELNSELGAILGKNGTGDDVYGISRNGLAYMVSHDACATWFSIPPYVYDRESSKRGFIHATFV